MFARHSSTFARAKCVSERPGFVPQARPRSSHGDDRRTTARQRSSMARERSSMSRHRASMAGERSSMTGQRASMLVVQVRRGAPRRTVTRPRRTERRRRGRRSAPRVAQKPSEDGWSPAGFVRWSAKLDGGSSSFDGGPASYVRVTSFYVRSPVGFAGEASVLVGDVVAFVVRRADDEEAPASNEATLAYEGVRIASMIRPAKIRLSLSSSRTR